MGYTTRFTGCIKLSRPLTFAEAKTLLAYAHDSEQAPKPNPGGYLQWVPSTTLDAIGWDGNEKFYDYVEWLAWVCTWLKAAGIKSDGVIFWSGETVRDVGTITVVDGAVSASKGRHNPQTFTPLTLEQLGLMAIDKLTT